MEKEQLQTLFKKYHEGRCTEEEKALLEAWYLTYNEQGLDISPKRIKAIGQRIFRELPGNHSSFIKAGIKLAVAAGLIGAMITLTIKLFLQPPIQQTAAIVHEIPPGFNTAVLTLANGRKINLGAASNGQIAQQPGIKIYKTVNGQINYVITGNPNLSDSSRTNNITTPKGGQWQVTLPDGSKVLLNSASSLKYPTSFKNRQQRIVQLTGEGYFEVAKDTHHPFIVMARNQRVEVLGTHFNISSYKDEDAVKTTLAEGRVKLSILGVHEPVFLIPGHQAIASDRKIQVNEVDVNEALAWKNGYFQFNDEPINSVMQKLSRWYDFDIIYKGPLPTDNINGKISRNKNLSQVLKALEATKTVHFKVEGRRITIMK